jgi:hypothetical protein
MKKLAAVMVLLMASVLLGSVAPGPAGQGTQIPGVSPKTPVAPAQVAKLQDPAITKLQEQVAMLIEQDRQKTAQLGQLKYQVGQLQTGLAGLKQSLPDDYISTTGPGGCKGGHTGIVNIAKDPANLVYFWHCAPK